MKIESEISRNKQKEKTYPYIGQSATGNIVLFIRKNTGVLLLDATLEDKVGCHSTTWVEDNFNVFDGEVTLNNKK